MINELYISAKLSEQMQLPKMHNMAILKVATEVGNDLKIFKKKVWWGKEGEGISLPPQAQGKIKKQISTNFSIQSTKSKTTNAC